jgi:hypothetical protein
VAKKGRRFYTIWRKKEKGKRGKRREGETLESSER